MALTGPATITEAAAGDETVVTVSNATLSESIAFAGLLAADYFTLADDGQGGVEIVVEGTPCFCPGTAILTEEGERPVETLGIGDRVMTRGGVARAIRWIGRRAYDGRFVDGRTDILPVTITQGALGAGLPRRDLTVSPLHAMFLGGVLVPALALVNGSTITQAARAATIDYLHIELDTHDVIFAQGAATETFLDDGSRGMFHNAAEYGALYPDAPRGAVAYCAPRVEDGDMLEAIRPSLLYGATTGVTVFCDAQAAHAL